MSALRCLLGLAFTAGLAPVSAQEGIRPVYETVFYKSGDLRIQAYLYKPNGVGSFPVVIYNHGSRRGHERDSVPFQYVGNLLLQRGFGVLVPERRGYGQSDGAQYSEEIGFDIGSRFIERLQAETGDVLASLDYLKTLSWVDQNQLGIMGWSFGGIVTMLATSRTDRFRAAVNQAGGSLTWPNSAALQKALRDAALRTKIPILLMAAKNDRTTDSITELAKILTKNQTPNKVILYDPFTPAQNPGNIAPGHLIFSLSGYTIWQDDVRNFFVEHLASAGGK